MTKNHQGRQAQIPQSRYPQKKEKKQHPLFSPEENTMNTQGGPANLAPANPGPAPPPQPTLAPVGENPRRPKIKEPDVFRGERSKLQEWLAQMKVYFRLVGWADGHNPEKIVYH